MLEEDDNGVYTKELINGTRRPFDSFDAQGDVMREVTKEQAATFLELKRKRVSERAFCPGGKGAGIDPSCGGGGGGKPAELPQDHAKYFTKDVAPSATYGEVSVDSLDATRARPEGIANANKLMREAYEGKNSPREPISVVKDGDRYKVMDGNSTYANAKQAGWKTMPVQIFKSEEDAKAHEQQKKEAKKKAAERAYCPGGKGAGIDPSCSSKAGGGGGESGGGGSGSAGSGGASGGSSAGSQENKPTAPQKVRKERLRDRIEGTQKEADREVKKADTKLKDLERQHKEIKQKIADMGSSGKQAKAAYESGMTKARAVREGKVAAAQAKFKAKMAEIAAKSGRRGIDQDLDQLDQLYKEAEKLFADLALEVAGLDEVGQQMEAFLKSLPAKRSMPEMRGMTISIDFDETFSLDPKMWGEFAMQAAATGNTVVMISRREDTPKNQKQISDTIGEHLHAFSQVMLIGPDMLKADAAAAAGLKVNVWVDDAPETVKG